ncbi:MAG: hypothetical protein ACYC2U_04060 [Candidatus Amoebophilus sp.]
MASPALRHVQGFQSLGLSVGSSLEAPCLSLDYTYHLSRVWHLQFSLGYAGGQKSHLIMNQLGLQALVARTLWSHQSNYYVNLLGGCNLGYRWQENIKGVKRKHKQNCPALSLLVGCGVELYLTNKLVLSLSLTPQVHSLNTDIVGMFQLLGTVGLHFAY